MSISLEHFCCIFLFMMPSQVDLSTCIRVAHLGFTISADVVCATMAYLELIKRSAHYASESDAITFLVNLC